MWALKGWGYWEDYPPCWENVRDAAWVTQAPTEFFQGAFEGRYCSNSGWRDESFDKFLPKLRGPAPALLGFDDDIQSLW